MNTHTIVADIHQSVSRTREHIDGQNRVVSVTLYSVRHRINADHYLDSRQVSNFNY